MTNTVETPNLRPSAGIMPAPTIFPGSRLTGLSMVAGPVLLVAGAALLVGIYDPSATDQLAGFVEHEARATVALNTAIAGTVLTVFAVLGLAPAVAARHRRLGRGGGALTIIGLFGPAFFLGVNHLGVHVADLADRGGVATAFEKAHTTPSIVNLTGPALVVGFILLAVGAAKSGVLSRSRSWALGLAAVAPLGLISGVVVISVVAWLALAVALVPLGFELLRSGDPFSD